MKDVFVESLQQQMDKCTNEQFWAVASITAADAFFITQRKDLLHVPTWVCISFLTLSTLYGIYFIVHRHIAYFRLHDARAKLLQGIADAPAHMLEVSNLRRIGELSGVLFYVGWIIAGYTLCWYVL